MKDEVKLAQEQCRRIIDLCEKGMIDDACFRKSGSGKGGVRRLNKCTKLSTGSMTAAERTKMKTEVLPEDDFNPLDECEGCVYKIWAAESCPPEKLKVDYISKKDVEVRIRELDFISETACYPEDRRSAFIRAEELRVLLEASEKVEVRR